LAQWSHQLSEVNEQLTEYDLYNCRSWKIKILHCKTIPPVLVNWMPAWLTVTRITCMQFWQENVNKFPKLYQLHLKQHCISAASAAMKRHFSASWMLDDPG